MKTRGIAFAFALLLGAGVAVAADPLPAGAKGFAGIISGKIVTAGTDQAVVEVLKVEKSWKHSEATAAESMVGKQIAVKVTPQLYAKKPGYQALVTAFFKALKVGDVESLDVRNKEGDGLTFLELTDAQRERVVAAAKPK
jgi:hypothetical protein